MLLQTLIVCAIFMTLLGLSVYTIIVVRRASEQFQRLEKLVKSLREVSTKARFMASNAKDHVSSLETVLQDMQSQIDILLQASSNNFKSEVNDADGDNNIVNPIGTVDIG